MSRRGLRDRWRIEVYRSQLIGDACRVQLLLMADHMTDRGVVSVPQEKLANELGVEVRRVKARIAEARNAGLLDKIGGGYRGRTAEYVATLPPRMGTAERYSLTGKGAVFRHPKNDTLSCAETARMGTAERPPNAGARACASVSERRERHDHERRVGVSPNHGLLKDSSDERAPAQPPLAAILQKFNGRRPVCARLRVAS